MNKISIVTPTYNTGRFIERTILSVKNQNYSDYEHIIVDAGSTDETLQIIKKYPEVTYVLKDKCTQSEALNIGFQKATGSIIGWVNSDDVYEPGAFGKASRVLDEHKDTDLVYSNCRFIDDGDKEIGFWKTAKFSYFRNLNYFQMIPQQTIFFRKSVFEKVGYIDESFSYTMDYDFLVRISKKCRVEYVPNEVFASFRLHSVSKTMAQRKKFEPEVIAVKKKHGAVVPYQFAFALQRFIGLFKKRL